MVSPGGFHPPSKNDKFWPLELVFIHPRGYYRDIIAIERHIPTPLLKLYDA